ncbi:hypothetical protein BDZ97DRAFT_1805981 [Flammula alnicola]|nr:hypothetical protein BDZ97DRAFT_1805981 [Flammula alnicola]
MSSSFLVPSHFGVPFLTTISDTKYDSRGRQMSFAETEVQRIERMAFVTASKSRSNSPTLSPISSGASSPVPVRLFA